MLCNGRLEFYTRYVPKLVIILLVLSSFGILSPAVANPLPQDAPAQVEPDAGTWQTWVLSSGDQLRLAVPPDEATTLEEITRLKEMAADRDDAALQAIDYWNAGPPSYRWNQIGVNALVKRAMGVNMATRNLALLNAAVYDATIAAWDSKYAHNRLRPSEVDASLETAIPNPLSPSYPSEYAVTAGAASTILAWLFPDDAQRFEEMAQEAVNSRLLAGVEYPSDVEAGLALGQQVAQLVIERGMADGSAAQWDGVMPTEAGRWTGENPGAPLAGTWQTWVLRSPDQFRPEAPPAYDSEQMATEMRELREFERTPMTNAIAMFWEFGAGGRRAYWLWNETLSRLILEARWGVNAPLAARAYALMNITSYEAMVACWDAKYSYWSMRPFQVDPEYTSVFPAPNFPSYPSAHSCISTATTEVIAALFPTAANEVRAMAQEAGESRIWGGIHFRSDIVAGTQLGNEVANAVLEYAMT